MAAGTFTLFSKNKNHINTADIAAATVKMAIVTSAWTPDVSVTGNYLWADVSANEIANGNGYTTGGNTLTTVTSTAVTGGYKLTSDPSTWTASGTGIPAHRYYVLYLSGTVWGLVNPLIGYFVGDSTPADIPLTTSGNSIVVTPAAGGLYDEV